MSDNFEIVKKGIVVVRSDVTLKYRKEQEDIEAQLAEQSSLAAASAARSSTTSRWVICLSCRRSGHTVKECPNVNKGSTSICYNCGSAQHKLSECPKPRHQGNLPFASCFVCNETGHIAGDCPQNELGKYPKGGQCLVCGSVRHFARDCPHKNDADYGADKERPPASGDQNFNDAEAIDGDF